MSTVDDTLYTLIEPLLSGEKLIFADQNAPRPVLPFWTLNSSPRRQVGSESYGQGVDDNGDQEVRGEREFTVQLQRIGSGSDDSLQNLRDELRLTTVMETWWKENISLYDTGDVKILGYPMDDHLEPRAILDLFIRYQIKQLDRVGIIDTVDVLGKYETAGDPATPGLDPNPALTNHFTIPV